MCSRISEMFLRRFKILIIDITVQPKTFREMPCSKQLVLTYTIALKLALGSITVGRTGIGEDDK